MSRRNAVTMGNEVASPTSNGKSEKYVVSASAVVPARRERVYSLIANYNDGHPRILPKQFSNLTVEQGGVGAGTVIRFQMSVLGKKETLRAAITEPEPGRVLVETYLDGKDTPPPRQEQRP